MENTATYEEKVQNDIRLLVECRYEDGSKPTNVMKAFAEVMRQSVVPESKNDPELMELLNLGVEFCDILGGEVTTENCEKIMELAEKIGTVKEAFNMATDDD